MNQSELLLPVGNMEMCLAAIHNGADAIYVGVPGFNARGRSKDHDLSELKEIIDLCHLYGVKVHLALNILIFENELPQIFELLKLIIPLGADAFIVQDLGLAKMIREICPNQVLHASTQMTITNDLAIDEVTDLNFQRFVLGRECSITEIEAIRNKTEQELEVFVHGALCVAYSGQCFTSEAIGGRSANRGQCAQSCRLEYELIVDDEVIQPKNGPYVVSPKDLLGLHEVPQLQKIGVNSFKVEGRLKGADYVASVGKAYKAAIDTNRVYNSNRVERDLLRTYSRGFFTGWLKGVEHQQLVDGSYSNHRGELLGKIAKIIGKRILVKTKAPVKNGDGVLIVGNNFQEGSFVYSVEQTQDGVLIGLANNITIETIQTGFKIYLNKDIQLEKDLAKTWTSRDQLKKIKISIVAHFKAGEVPLLKVKSHGVVVTGEQILEMAKNAPTDYKKLREELSSFGNSPFVADQIELKLDKNLFVPSQLVKNLKKQLVEKLHFARTHVENVELKEFDLPKEKIKEIQSPKINLLFRNHEQLSSFVKLLGDRLIVGDIYLDYEFGQDYASSLELLSRENLNGYIATTRILKPNELYNLKNILRLAPKGVLVRNLGALNFFKKHAPNFNLVGDFSLNVTNSLTADYLLNKGLQRITLGLDLNQWQVDDLVKNIVNPSGVEAIVHQYMPEFHMEHCVFAYTLSEGSSFKDCGKPCEKHQVSLKDPYGNVHHLAADHECRNTMFQATPQVAVGLLNRWHKNGIENFRLEALRESGLDFFHKFEKFRNVLTGVQSSEVVLKELGLMEKFGVTSDSIERQDSYRDRKNL